MKEGSWKLYHSLCLLQKFSREGNRPQGWGNPRAPLLQVDPCTHTNSCAYLQEWSADRVEWHRLPLELSSPWELGETDSSRSYNKKKSYLCHYYSTSMIHMHIHVCTCTHVHVHVWALTQLNLSAKAYTCYARYWYSIELVPMLTKCSA